ncbi:MAG: M20/M25/M40 family metallo-hydrolase [Acidobacteriota bacterium]|nr:M20/M25/M40 family metallo-hydrolase [Acidobacteriota bacterium]
MVPRVALAAAIAACLFAVAGISTYAENANKLIGAALKDTEGLRRLEYLCYRIGNRPNGSQALARAIEWSVDEMKRAGLENVRTIPVRVPHWVRGRESAVMVEPQRRPLFMLGLGGSTGAPKGGITADVVTVSTFGELEKLGRAAVEGKIVLYDAPFTTYDETVEYRNSGASRAARLGAVAALVRSVTPASLRDPHTGALDYTPADPKIPSAAVSVEDAIWIHHLTQAGEHVRVHLEMEAHYEADADSADAMGEIVGRELPEQVVVVGGHLDSWDVGQGAQDDGSGAVAALEAVTLMKQLGLRPRRTVRVVLWVDEENGGNGGAAYRRWLGAKAGDHYAAIEMDSGAEQPLGFNFTAPGREAASPRGGASAAVKPEIRKRAEEAAGLLARIGAASVRDGAAEADVEPLLSAGIPAFGLRTATEHYWNYHHSEADTFDKVDPGDFRKCVAALAAMTYTLADWR